MKVDGKLIGYGTPEGHFCLTCSYGMQLKPSDECHPIGSNELPSDNDLICDGCGEVLRNK